MYNEIITIPILGFADNTKEALAKKRKGSQLLNNSEDHDSDEPIDDNYMATSPSNYDSNRNKRKLHKEDYGDDSDPDRDGL